MKQTKFGLKVQNWHRPLAPGQLKHSFRRHRYDDVGWENEFVDDPCAHHVFCGWEYYGWEWSESDESIAMRFQKIKEVLDDRISTTTPWLSSPQFNIAADAEPPQNCNADPSQPWEIESKLFTFLDRLTSCSERSSQYSDDLSVDELIQPHIGSIDTMSAVVKKHDWPESLVKNLCLFSAFWIRDPGTFQGESANDFVCHLFSRFESPRSLHQVWFRNLDLDDLKWHSWFLIFTQGGSLHRAAKMFDWSVSKRLQGEMLKVPADQTAPLLTCMHAEIVSMGGSPAEFLRLAANPAFVIDPTDRSVEPAMVKFWKSTVRWLVQHGNEIGDQETGLVLDWAMHQFTEARALPAGSNQTTGSMFSWKGRSARATVERSIEYLRQRERTLRPTNWHGRGWDWSTDDGVNSWTLAELTTSKQLRDEGLAMSHCVGGYAPRCARGDCAIFSMCCNDQRVLTVEIDPDSLRILQAKGQHNRASHAKENRILKQWCEHIASLARVPRACRA